MDKKLQGMHIISSNLRSLHPLHYGIVIFILIQPHIGSHKLAESTLIVYLNELGWVLYQRRSMHNYFVLVIF